MDDSSANVKSKSAKYCTVDGCNVRLSILDPHTLCPFHIGFLCEWDKRCETCKQCTDSAMSTYLNNRKRLLKARIRKQNYRARKVAGEDFASCKTVSDVSEVSKSHSPVSSDSESSVPPAQPVKVPSPTHLTPTSNPKAHGIMDQVRPEDMA